MEYNRTVINFSAKKENINFARNSVIFFLHELNLNIDRIANIKTMIEEAVKNSIIHGYKNEENEINRILILVKYNKKEIVINIKDFGVGIEDIEEAKSPFYSSNGSEGLGFTILDVFSDELKVTSNESETNVEITLKL
jgi:stage II sporulation protein AB (anti-sigma F factor)